MAMAPIEPNASRTTAPTAEIPLRVLLAVEGDAGSGHLVQVRRQLGALYLAAQREIEAVPDPW
jgi:hypothetical protein